MPPTSFLLVVFDWILITLFYGCVFSWFPPPNHHHHYYLYYMEGKRNVNEEKNILQRPLIVLSSSCRLFSLLYFRDSMKLLNRVD